MSRFGVTFDDVVNAALAIQQRGENPTIDKIRAHLGGTGSNSTISKYLSAWRNQSELMGDEIQGKPATPDIVKAAVERVWQDMRESTDTEIAAIKEEAKQQVDDAIAEQKRINEAMEALRAEHTQLLEAHHAVCAEKELLMLDIKAMKEEKQLLAERHEGLQQKHDELQHYFTRYSEDIAKAHVAELERIQSAHIEQVALLTKQLDEQKQRYEAERQQQMFALDQVKVENKKQVKLNSDLSEKNQSQATEIATISSQLDETRNNLKRAEVQLNEEKNKWQQFNDKILVDQDVAQKLMDLPALESVAMQLKQHMTAALEEKWLAFAETMHSLTLLNTSEEEPHVAKN